MLQKTYTLITNKRNNEKQENPQPSLSVVKAQTDVI